MAPYPLSSHTLILLSPIYRRMRHNCPLTISMDIHSPKFRSKSFFWYWSIPPIQSHITYIRPRINNKITFVITIFSGFMSLCRISFSCKYSTAEQICFSFVDAYYSCSFFDFFMNENSDPSYMY